MLCLKGADGMPPVLYVIIPCFNEEKVLPVTSGMFLGKLNELIGNNKIQDRSRILFVNDGSKDSTWKIINDLSKQDCHFAGISLSRNRGHQNALLAGLMEAKDQCDITISIDCDGQDDINVMDEMVDAWYKGSDIVYGVRSDRGTDTFLKRGSAELFYKLMRWLGVESIANHADYRLVSSRVLQEFSKFEEVNIYLRGMFPLVGFNSTCVYYRREARLAGETHYPLRKMLALAADGITSLSVKPIRMITSIGFLISFFSMIGVIWAIAEYLFGVTVSGWASMVCIICFVSGIQLISLGVIGEYIGKIYLETKHRPRYIISEKTGSDEERE